MPSLCQAGLKAMRCSPGPFATDLSAGTHCAHPGAALATGWGISILSGKKSVESLTEKDGIVTSMGTPKNWTHVAKRGALLLALVAAGAVGVGLTDKVDPVFPGVMFTKMVFSALPGTYCSAGVPVATADGELGLLIASRCTDPFGPRQLRVPASRTTFAGYSIDWGTYEAYHEPDRQQTQRSGS